MMICANAESNLVGWVGEAEWCVCLCMFQSVFRAAYVALAARAVYGMVCAWRVAADGLQGWCVRSVGGVLKVWCVVLRRGEVVSGVLLTVSVVCCVVRVVRVVRRVWPCLAVLSGAAEC